ncbi:response regulator [Paenibacillus sp. P96]|uniref:Response regulator n=1 Tax=Paenibacillus zeirhizosphaerae TaxID=2987519 RepID=A0ABT9FVT0_9BACL|nr:response regulator [Paenibacillus sp. P96]MDP4098841.1 response regulator [Paenibacillus sp. P96]
MTHRILLVEDEKWVRTALRKVIEKINLPFAVVHESSNGMEAWKWLEHSHADIVVTDIRMPVMDGLTLLKQIREKLKQTDTIIVSGHDEFAYAQQAVRLGAFDYFLKPVDTGDITECFRNWLQRYEPDPASTEAQQAENQHIRTPVDQVIHYIESHHRYDLMLAEAAALVHLNSSYFCKLFKQQKGMTFTDFLTSVRMREAVRLLEHTSLRITEIADRLGFADAAYFSNTFKKEVGASPSEYRKRLHPA